MTEAERAAEHRRQRAARRDARCENLDVTLAGDPAAREALGRAWAPPVNALLEAQLPEPLGPDGEEIVPCP